MAHRTTWLRSDLSRLIKRRTVANDACDTEHISVNGKAVKASYQVKEGDIISIAFGTRTLTVKVVDVRENANKSNAGEMYEVISQ